MRETKKSRILSELKRQVFAAPHGVSRREVAEHLAIDLRTAGAYLEQLCTAGLLCRETRQSIRRGRPGSVYCANARRLVFLGLVITQQLEIVTQLIDSEGHILAGETLTVAGSPSHMTLFNAVAEAALQYRDFRGCHLSGVGLAISRWLQPPLAGGDLYGAFEAYLARALNVPVYRDVNINAVAYACAVTSGKRDLAVIHAGHVIEFGLVKAGEPVTDFAKREMWLSHLCVNPKGRQCYCGKYGCLVNYITAAALRERLALNDSALNIRTLGEMLGFAFVRVAKHFPELESLLFIGASPLQKTAADYFARHAAAPELLQTGELAFSSVVAFGAALEAAHFELYQYLPEMPKIEGNPFRPLT